MAVVYANSCSSSSPPSLWTSTCYRCGPKKTKNHDKCSVTWKAEEWGILMFLVFRSDINRAPRKCVLQVGARVRNWQRDKLLWSIEWWHGGQWLSNSTVGHWIITYNQGFLWGVALIVLVWSLIYITLPVCFFNSLLTAAQNMRAKGPSLDLKDNIDQIKRNIFLYTASN